MVVSVLINKICSWEYCGRILDRISLPKIVLLILVICIFLASLSYFVLIIPLEQKIEEHKIQQKHFISEINELETKRSFYFDATPDSIKLLESVNEFRTVFQKNFLIIDEIQTNYLSPLENTELSQLAVRVSLTGSLEDIINALVDIKNIKQNTYLIEEIDFNEKKGIINYKMIYVK